MRLPMYMRMLCVMLLIAAVIPAQPASAKKVSAVSSVKQYEYDDDEWGLYREWNITYDNKGRVSKIEDRFAGSSEGREGLNTITYQYTKKGSLKKITDVYQSGSGKSKDVSEFKYDKKGRLKSNAFYIDGKLSSRTVYKRNSSGKLTETVTYNGKKKKTAGAKYTYKSGLLSSLSQTGGGRGKRTTDFKYTTVCGKKKIKTITEEAFSDTNFTMKGDIVTWKFTYYKNGKLKKLEKKNRNKNLSKEYGDTTIETYDSKGRIKKQIGKDGYGKVDFTVTYKDGLPVKYGSGWKFKYGKQDGKTVSCIQYNDKTGNYMKWEAAYTTKKSWLWNKDSGGTTAAHSDFDFYIDSVFDHSDRIYCSYLHMDR